MSWRNGSAHTPLGAANTPITVTTTTPIASGERVILFVFREQAATGTAVGSPTVSTLGGNAFTTIDALENFTSPQYGGLSCHSFIAPGAIGSGATLSVTPGHANQKVAAMLIVQGDPHPTQPPESRIINGRDVDLVQNQWPRVDAKGMMWDKRLLIAVGASQNASIGTPWVTVTPGSSAPLNGFTEALDATQFSYIFEIAIREQDSTDGELSPFVSGSGSNNQFSSAVSAQQQGFVNFIRAGAVQAALGTDVFDYNDFPSRNLPGSGSRPSVGQLWPR